MENLIKDLVRQGIQLLKNGDLQRAEKNLLEAEALEPKNSETLLYLGLTYAHQGSLNKAKNCFIRSVNEGGGAEPHYNLGIIYTLEKNLLGAVEEYEKSLSINPKHVESLTNLSDLYNQLQLHDKALTTANQALNIGPIYPETWINQGKALTHLGRKAEAVNAFRRSVELKPFHREGLLLLADTLDEAGETTEALRHYDLYINQYPNNGAGHINKGALLQSLKQYDEAMLAYDRALLLQPNDPLLLTNRGCLLRELNRYNEALLAFDAVLATSTDHIGALRNKGQTLLDMDMYIEALALFERLLEAHPETETIQALIFHIKMRLCDWSSFEIAYKNLAQDCDNDLDTCTPFASLGIFDNALTQKKIAERWTDKIISSSRLTPSKILSRKKTGKIRIGYYSPDFKDHAVSYLIAELIELHDRDLFEIIAFSFGPNESSPMQDRLRNSFDKFFDVACNSDLEIAMLSRELGIDIAVDLCGHTDQNRLGIFLNRAAPIQVSYLGHPGTLGSASADYLIADSILVPECNDTNFTEKIIRLPNSFQINDRKRPIAQHYFTKEQFGLPETGLIYCCFNNNYKITPYVFECWMKILKSVDHSVLWLLEDLPGASNNLRKEAEKAGVDPARLIFSGRIPRNQYLSRYLLADIFLDTSPFNGGTTASDALWAGLPIITKMGNAYAGRMASSLLAAMGLNELITHSDNEYIDLAIELGLNQHRLTEINSRLAENKGVSPLFNSPLTTKHLETAFIKIFERHANGLPPESITIPSA